MTWYLLVVLLFILLLLIVVKIRKIYKGNFINRFSQTHAMVEHKIPIDFLNDRPDYYYADFTKCILNKPHFIDKNNIFKIGGSSEEVSVFNICGICEFAILNLEKYLSTRDIDAYHIFKSNLEWIYNNATIKDKLPYWHYNYNFGTHKAPWTSAISQGMVMSVLVRGYVHLKQEKYLTMAIETSKTIDLPIHENGFKYCYDHFQCWFEESNNNSHILNGHIFTLLGIYDLYRCTRDEKLNDLFMKGCYDIKNNIHFFELGFSSKYDAVQMYPADNSYHKIHIVLFNILFQLTADDFFKRKAVQWERVYTSNKLKFFGFIYTINETINNKIIKFCR